MSLLAKLLCVPIWLLSLFGCLKIHELDLDLGHSICGPWGCGPPIEALLGYHAFWLVLITPIAIAVGAYLNPISRRKVGLACLLVGVIMVAVVAGGDTFGYWKRSGSGQHLVQRFFFAIATKVDLPMWQMIATGGLLAWVGASSYATGNAVSLQPIATDNAEYNTAPEVHP